MLYETDKQNLIAAFCNVMLFGLEGGCQHFGGTWLLPSSSSEYCGPNRLFQKLKLIHNSVTFNKQLQLYQHHNE
jgi:hypothetical protein